MKPKPDAPRWLHWLYAMTHSYFWLPCSMCGVKRGGHEEHGSLMDGPGSGCMVCRHCAKAAERINAENDYFRRPVVLK